MNINTDKLTSIIARTMKGCGLDPIVGTNLMWYVSQVKNSLRNCDTAISSIKSRIVTVPMGSGGKYGVLSWKASVLRGEDRLHRSMRISRETFRQLVDACCDEWLASTNEAFVKVGVVYFQPLPELLSASGESTANLSDATSVRFDAAIASANGNENGNSTLTVAVDAKAGYKDYSLLSILGGRDVPAVSFLDRRDLLDYLTGVSDSSPFVAASASEKPVSLKRAREHTDDVRDSAEAIRPKISSSVGSVLPLSSSTSALPSAKSELDSEIYSEEEEKERVIMMADYEQLKDTIFSRERCIVDFSNFLSHKVTKNFSNAIKYAGEILRPGHISTLSNKSGQPGTSKPVDSRAQRPVTSSTRPSVTQNSSKDVRVSAANNNSSKVSQKSSNSSLKPTAPPMKPSPNARIPIIIVPPSITSVITIYNAKKLLGELKFQSTDDCIKNFGAGEKPLMVTLERKNAPQGFPKMYHIYDNVDRLKPEDWDRIVAVFATGQEWQFKNWRFGPPVNIFARVRGFCLKYVDDPVNEKIKGWNVIQFNIHKTKRHLDTQTVNDFWTAVEAWIRDKRASQFLR
ncbi:accessory factor associated with RNA polymerase II, partial [Physocladia obscura]